MKETTEAEAAIVARVRAAGATDIWSAKSLYDLGVVRDATFDTLVERGLIRRAIGREDRYFVPIFARDLFVPPGLTKLALGVLALVAIVFLVLAVRLVVQK